MQKCMFCNSQISDDRPLTVCDVCGQKVWGKKMFSTIVQNMTQAREKGDLCHTGPLTELKNEFGTSTEIR